MLCLVDRYGRRSQKKRWEVMASKASNVVLGRSATVKLPQEWLDGDVWALEAYDYAPHTPEVARQLIRSKAMSKFKTKIATKIVDDVLYIQAVPMDELVVEKDKKK